MKMYGLVDWMFDVVWQTNWTRWKGKNEKIRFVFSAMLSFPLLDRDKRGTLNYDHNKFFTWYEFLKNWKIVYVKLIGW